MTIDPNHEPLKRAVYLTDEKWTQVIVSLEEDHFSSGKWDQYFLDELAKEIQKQLGRSS